MTESNVVELWATDELTGEEALAVAARELQRHPGSSVMSIIESPDGDFHIIHSSSTFDRMAFNLDRAKMSLLHEFMTMHDGD